MGQREYELQWQSLMADNQFSETATITDNESVSFSVKGLFISGSFDEEAAAPYAPKRYVRKQSFRVSSMEIPSQIEKPWDSLEGMVLILDRYGIDGNSYQYRISDVLGKMGGEYTLLLQEVESV